MKNTTLIFAGQKTSLLSWTADMDCWSFSLPAGYACPLSTTGENHICDSCYAMFNRYNMSNVQRAQWIRFLWLKDCLRTETGRLTATNTLRDAINMAVENNYFRVHDSGDFFHPNYIRMWRNICQALPHIQFWFPTRCWWSTSNKWILPLVELNSLPNVSVRPSALEFNHPPPIRAFALSAGTAVVTAPDELNDIQLCPKSKVGGTTCEGEKCRRCWNKQGEVKYLVHTQSGVKKPLKVSEKIKNNRAKFAEEIVSITLERTEINP